MAYILNKVGQSFNVPVHIYEADTEEDMNTIDIQGVPMGSKCHIINDDKWYMLNSDGKWKAMPKQVQPDWNQNDDTAADYVKNRPFYTGDPVETVLVEESTVTFEDAGGIYMASFPKTFEATGGETYKVSWDGTIYECTCVDYGGGVQLVIGNLSIVGEGSDTGEPFVMGIKNGEGIMIATADTSASHTISISGVAAPVVKIDKRYLPSTIPFMENGKIPEKYVQEILPDASDVFGGVLAVGGSYSTLENPYPNKRTLSNLSVEKFNDLYNGNQHLPRHVDLLDAIGNVTIDVSRHSIVVNWNKCDIVSNSGNPISSVILTAYVALIHEDTDNPGTMVSEYARIEVAKKIL